MRRPSRFEVRGALLWPLFSHGAPMGATPVPEWGTAAGGDAIRELLQSLRGQQVVLQVGSLRREGKLLSVEPLILVGPEGRATMIRLEAVAAVEF